MATTRKHIAAAPERVFAVLTEPGNYADWVVGSDTIRDADPPPPARAPRPRAAARHGRRQGVVTPSSRSRPPGAHPPVGQQGARRRAPAHSVHGPTGVHRGAGDVETLQRRAVAAQLGRGAEEQLLIELV